MIGKNCFGIANNNLASRAVQDNRTGFLSCESPRPRPWRDKRHAVATSGIAFSQTLSIAASSTLFSAGMYAVSGNKSDITTSLGAVSYNWSKKEFGFLGKKGNSFAENLGYGFGALANVSDILAGFRPGEVQLQTENLPEENNKDLIGHTQLLDKNGSVLIDFGPKQAETGRFIGFSPGRNNWLQYSTNGTIREVKNLPGNKFNQGIPIKGVNLKTLSRISNKLNNNPGSYNFLLRSCSSVASRALAISGAPIFGGIHPYLLRLSLILRNAGVRPSLYSYYLTQ